MTRIDTHHHVVPPTYAKLLTDRGLTPGGVDVPEWSPELALKLMKKVDVSTAILSLSTPGVWFGEAKEAMWWAREVNSYSAQVMADHPGRFGFFATLTLPDVDAAIIEADYALDVLGADGVVLLANEAGMYLGDAHFDKLLAHLNARNAIVFIHPGELPAAPVPGIPSFTADFLLDTTRAAISLILSGAMDKYTNIKFILAHAGGFLPYISYRVLLTMLREQPKLTQARAIVMQGREVPKYLDPMKRFYYDVALSSTPAAFPSLMAIADSDRILYGSDFPFAPGPAVTFMAGQYESFEMSAVQRDGIDRRNAEMLFPRLATEATEPTAGTSRLFWRKR